jgi:hypothetical protein
MVLDVSLCLFTCCQNDETLATSFLFGRHLVASLIMVNTPLVKQAFAVEWMFSLLAYTVQPDLLISGFGRRSIPLPV